MPKNNDTENTNNNIIPDPITFMRMRHPDLYSDSQIEQKPDLTEDLLGYHLETLTNRNQETDFSYFARRLAQKEICPNLRPQTGPVGGGDSKADGETIPVSTEIAELWVGNDPNAASERWAFAFSAKKTWKSKVAADVQKISETERGYTRIYFITNQFAPDKSRADSEDKLSKKFGIPVTILDRTWITKAVIENDRIDLAIETLKIDSLTSSIERKFGPADFERQRELEELERDLSDPECYAGARYQLFEDSLRAALLARGLGRPRAEIDGLFIRAQRIAENTDSDKQRLRGAYNYAWTLIFWFDDYIQLNAMYDHVAGLALKSNQAEEVELAANLWNVLQAQVARGVLSAEMSKLDDRKRDIIAALDILSADKTRPNNALQARTTRAVISISEAVATDDRKALDQVWITFQEIAKDAELLGDYPFERLTKLINEFANLGADNNKFDTLFEFIIQAIEKRKGEAASAEHLKERGFTKSHQGKHYEAISLLGRALERFIKREHRDDLISCLMGLSFAYSDAGLLWAARSCALGATERCFAYFHEEGKIISLALPCLQQLERIELSLGRIPHFLLCWELEAALLPQLRLQDSSMHKALDRRQLMEGMFGICLLSSSIEQLKMMQDLPDTLDEMDLFISRGCLLYALGHGQELLNEGFKSESEIADFMKLAYSQPGRLQLPQTPQIDNGKSIIYRTNVLGCAVTLTAPTNSYSISLAEAVLGSVEAFFATSLNEHLMLYRQSVEIVLEPSAACTRGLEVSNENEQGRSFLLVKHPITRPEQSIDTQAAERDGLMSVIALFITHIAMIGDIEEYFNRIAGTERGFARALIYAEASLAQANVFGDQTKVLIGDWKPQNSTKQYSLARETNWFQGLNIQQIPLPEDEKISVRDNQEDDQHAFFGGKMTHGKHSDRRIISLIDIPLWNEARWGSTMYVYDPDIADIPILALGFENEDAAAKIFEGWQHELGDADNEEHIRVTIVRGVLKDRPSAYRVNIGANIDRAKASEMMITVSRKNTMTPTSTKNLDDFLKTVSKFAEYLLVPAVLRKSFEKSDIRVDLGIRKRKLFVKNAWEIGMHDEDAPCLAPDDDPIIPKGTENPPCEEVLNFMRKRTKS